jgi:hypothetical protein
MLEAISDVAELYLCASHELVAAARGAHGSALVDTCSSAYLEIL